MKCDPLKLLTFSTRAFLQSTMHEWQYVFGIGALVYIMPGIIFICFGSGEVQKWNDKKIATTDEAVVQST